MLPSKFIISSKSVELDQFPVDQKTERGDILCAGYIIEEIDENITVIKTYSEVNSKNSLPPLIVKIPVINQIKKFVEKTYKLLTEKT